MISPSLWPQQPFKAIFIIFRVSSLVVLLPYWYIYYAFPSLRPRRSWNLNEAVMVRLIHWMMPINWKCKLNLLSFDKARQLSQSELKESSFIWLNPVEPHLVQGPAKHEKIKPMRIPGYVWPKFGDFVAYNGLVGLFMHGGGYMMGNASETYGELRIVRDLHKISEIKMILSVDYRLIHEGSHPAQLIDALSAYAYLVNVAKVDPSRIVIMGACAGGHLALMLARYLHDEKILPMPAGIMLFSPWLDMVIDGKIEQGTAAERPNTDIDLLNTSYVVNLRFLGHHSEELFSSPLLSGNLAPTGSYVGYPKTFISIGECEAWRMENEQLRDAMVRDGVDVTLDMQEDAVHDFWGFGDIVPSKKARAQVARNAVDWISSLRRSS
ncbi:hypothetical protein APHAL10511_007798 [Amanita phalloides]|nr:hypothetical protein APHAL10511_007798 [Amanita phalloides]